jgi:hypothetical protein
MIGMVRRRGGMLRGLGMVLSLFVSCCYDVLVGRFSFKRACLNHCEHSTNSYADFAEERATKKRQALVAGLLTESDAPSNSKEAEAGPCGVGRQ